MPKRVVITGMGILTALGRGLPDTAAALKDGKSGASKIAAFDSDRYAGSRGCEIAEEHIAKDFSDHYGRVSDRASYVVLTACRDAFLNASLRVERDELLEASVFLGTTLGGMLSGQKFHKDHLLDRNKDKRASLLKDYLAGQALYAADIFGLAGEALILNNACASGLNAIGLGYRRIRAGEMPIAIAGGYDVMSEFTYAGFSSLQLVTNEKCRPFDKERNGLILGEGAGIMILEELDHALSRGVDIIAEVIGFGQSSDAFHLTKPDPEARGACSAIAEAIREADIMPAEIDYVNAHGTGTMANDTMEAKAINMALGDHGGRVPVSSTKPMTGHTLGAAGAVDAVICAIAMKSGVMPANLNYSTPDPECKLNIIHNSSRAAELKTVLSNSFGFGGLNGAILLRKIGENGK